MAIIFVLIIDALVALLGRDRKIGYGWSLFACLFLTPLIGLIIILSSKKNDTDFIEIKDEREVK
jgi:hypothetical protein